MGSLCIAHVSDTHVVGTATPYRGVDVDGRTRSVFERITVDGQADIVVHTGDIIARDADPTVAYGFYGELLQAVPVPVMHIPGNHDRPDLWSDGGTQRAEAVFQSEPAWVSHVKGWRRAGSRHDGNRRRPTECRRTWPRRLAAAGRRFRSSSPYVFGHPLA
ncbi:MAG: hypothetical protein GVY29_07295 [Spirochaetes bacterium]|jgi:hypothetical protein|nr:hypothetical protein [Spirochaetota bacterium]